MPQIIIPIAISAALQVIGYLIAPKPGSTKSQPSDLRTTSNASGTPWPDFLGDGYVYGNLIWDGAYNGEPVNVDANTETWKRSWALGLCAGPIDELREIRWDDKCTIWSGSLKREDAVDGFIEGTSSKGKFRIYFGTDDQVADAWWGQWVGTLPPMRGLAYIVFERNQIERSTTLPNVSCRVVRYAYAPWNDPDVGATDAIAALWDRLTHPLRGAIDAALLDADAFEDAVAQAAEVGGGALVINEAGQQSLLDAAEKILYHCDGAIIIRDGKLVPRIMPRDIDLGSLTPYTAADIRAVRHQPEGWSELPNQFEVVYAPLERGSKEDSIPLPDADTDPADVRKETVRLPYISSPSLAALIGNRKAQHLGTAHDVIEVDFLRTAFRQEWGDLILINYAEEGLDGSMPWRVINFYDTAIGDETITVVLMLDHFRAATITAPGEVPGPGVGGEGDPTESTPIAVQRGLEIEWPDDSKRCTLNAIRPTPGSGAFELWGSGPGEPYTLLNSGALYCAGGVLLDAYPATTLTVDDYLGIRILSLSDDIAAFASVTREQFYGRALLARFDSGELIAIQQIIPLGGLEYRLLGIIRALDDTDVAAHGVGEKLFIPRHQTAVPMLASWTEGETVNLKGIPTGVSPAVLLDDAPAVGLTVRNRARRPYPVSNVCAQVGAGTLPVGHNLKPTYAAGNTVRLSWLPRTRGAGCGFDNPQGPFDPSIAVEGDFVIRIYDADGTTLLRTFVVAAGVTFADALGVTRHYADYDASLDGNPAQFTAKITSRISGWESLVSRDITVVKT
jgi:hypothetical protein